MGVMGMQMLCLLNRLLIRRRSLPARCLTPQRWGSPPGSSTPTGGAHTTLKPLAGELAGQMENGAANGLDVAAVGAAQRGPPAGGGWGPQRAV
jgi:hypothetical protein